MTRFIQTNREMQSRPSTNLEPVSLRFSDLLILGAGALILALPMILYGPMVQGHDTYEHLNYCRHFAEQFWAGEWYPRWLLNMCHGLGSPSLFVYPPFASYLDAFLLPLAKILHFNAFNAVEFLALFASGVCAFLWAGTLANRGAALASAFLYMLLPYHLSIDFYRRTALSECWALAWMPLLLYFATQVIARKRMALLGISVAYALLILSHMVSVVIFSLIPLGLTLLLFTETRIEAALRVAAGMTLGTGLSCFYFLPALLQAKHFPVLPLLQPPYFVLADNFIQLSDLIHRSAMSGFNFWLALAAVTVLALIAIGSAVLFRRGDRKSRPQILFWMAVCVIAVFLMSSLSQPVWNGIPPLFKAVQYPWRFNIVLCLAALFITARFLSGASRFSLAAKIPLFAFFGVIVLSWVIAYAQIWKRYRVDTHVPPARQFVSDEDGWFDSWAPQGTDQASALQASSLPRVRFVVSPGSIDVSRWQARHIEFQINSPSGGWVEINQFSYPGWQAIANAAPGSKLEMKTVLPEGLMAVNVPPGSQTIRVDLPAVPGERAGVWISLASILCFGFLARWMKPPTRSDIPAEIRMDGASTVTA
jgi:hypothetical protein